MCYSLSLFGQLPTYLPKNGLIGWYPFNGNSKDESGNGFNGTVNGPVLKTDRFGDTNRCYSFNGKTDYIKLGNFSNRNFYKSKFTISLWFYNEDKSHSTPRIIFGKDSGCAGGGQFEICLDGSGTTCTNYNNIGMTGDGFGQMCYSPNNLDTKWDMITMVKGDSFGLLYWNGKLVSSQKLDTNVVSGSKNFDSYLGCRLVDTVHCNSYYHGLGSFFWGRIDDVGIWSRNLDSFEVQSLYTGSVVSGLDEETTLKDVITYPNPVTGSLHIKVSNRKVERLKIINSIGQYVFGTNVTKSLYDLDMSRWNKGIYLLQLMDRSGSILEVRKIILQ